MAYQDSDLRRLADDIVNNPVRRSTLRGVNDVQIWSYVTDDSLADVSAGDYFDAGYRRLTRDDIILFSAEGGWGLNRVEAVDRTARTVAFSTLAGGGGGGAVTSVAGQIGNVTTGQLITAIDAIADTNFLTDAERTALTQIQDFGTVFTGTIIPDGADIQTALQALETAVGTGEILENAGALAGAVPTGAKLGIDTTSGQVYYNNGGNWAAVPGASVDLNTTVSDQTGGNGTGATTPAAQPTPTPDIGDLHIEVYDDVWVYFTAVATNWTAPAVVEVPRSGAVDVTVADATARDALTNLVAGQHVFVTDDDGSGNPQLYYVSAGGATFADATTTPLLDTFVAPTTASVPATNVAAGAQFDASPIAFTDAAFGQAFVAAPPYDALAQGLDWKVAVESAGNVKLTITNLSGAPVNVPAGDWSIYRVDQKVDGGGATANPQTWQDSGTPIDTNVTQVNVTHPNITVTQAAAGQITVGLIVDSVTTAQISSAADAINTTDKVLGRLVRISDFSPSPILVSPDPAVATPIATTPWVIGFTDVQAVVPA